MLAEDSGSGAVAHTAWLATCDVEYANLRAAMDYTVEARLAEWAMRFGNALLPFWQARARLQEGRDALTRALALTSPEEVSSIRARALFTLGTIVFPMGEPNRCEALAGQALEIYRSLGDLHGQAVALNSLGVSYHTQQRYEEARRAFGEAVPIWRALGLEEASVRTLANLASVALETGDADGAIAIYRDTRVQCDRTGDAAGAAWALNGEARVEHLRSASAMASPLYEEALQRFERIQDGWGAGDSLLALGLIAGETGQQVTARERLTRALVVFQKVGDIRGTLRIIEAAAHLAARDGRAERALTLAGAAAAARHTLATPLPRPQQERLEKTLDAARRRSGAAAGRCGLDARLVTVGGRGGRARLRRVVSADVHGVEHPANGRNPVRGNPGAARMLLHRGFIRRQVDAVDLALGDVAVEPLNLRPERTESFHRLQRNGAQLGVGELAGVGDVPFDDVLRHGG